ncbi:MAG: carboxylating nicotinate-nucleotide diphosphorylase [Candidatus Bathyarchaeota archaeon]
MDKERAYDRDLEKYRDRVIAQAKLALDEDIGDGDITTKAVVKNQVEDAIIITKANGVLCGLLEAKSIFEEGGLEFNSEKMEGDILKKGDTVAKVRGNVQELLKRERIALNYLQILSGIATATNRIVRKYPGKVAGLRKTHPGLGYSEKRAIKVGGGFTHRLGLYDGMLIKDNHLAAITKEIFKNGPINEDKKVEAIREALQRAKKYKVDKQLTACFIEIEVESLKQAIAAAKFYREEGMLDIILLDNMSAKIAAECVKGIRREAGQKVLIESSGGITLKNIGSYCEAGVDIISTSKITLSAEPLDMSMKIVGYK